MRMADAADASLLSREEVLEKFETFDRYENALKMSEPFEMSKEWLSKETNKLLIARDWLSKIDPSLFFVNVEEVED